MFDTRHIIENGNVLRKRITYICKVYESVAFQSKRVSWVNFVKYAIKTECIHKYLILKQCRSEYIL
jgi:hypothetical protein